MMLTKKFLRNELYVRPTKSEPMKIVAAAILVEDHIWTGRSHAEILEQMQEDGITCHIEMDQEGFITDNGIFARRAAAREIARQSGQIPEDFTGRLISADLW